MVDVSMISRINKTLFPLRESPEILLLKVIPALEMADIHNKDSPTTIKETETSQLFSQLQPGKAE